MKISGRRLQYVLTPDARGDLLKQGALFNDALHRPGRTTGFPRGIYRYESHEEADRHMATAIAECIASLHRARHDR